MHILKTVQNGKNSCSRPLNLHRIRSANGGQYSTAFATAATANNEGSGENEKPSFVSFIIRTMTMNGAYYTWQVQLSAKHDKIAAKYDY